MGVIEKKGAIRKGLSSIDGMVLELEVRYAM